MFKYEHVSMTFESMAALSNSVLQENGIRLRAEPTKTLTEVKIYLANAVRKLFPADTNGNAALGAIAPVLQEQGRSMLQGRAEPVDLDPAEVFLIEGRRQSSWSFMGRLSETELGALVREKPITVAEHMLPNGKDAVYVIEELGFLDGGNHRTYFACRFGMESIPARVVLQYRPDDRRGEFIVGDTATIMETLPKDEIRYGTFRAPNGSTDSVWATSIVPSDTRWHAVAHLPKGAVFVENIADLLLLRGAERVYVTANNGFNKA